MKWLLSLLTLLLLLACVGLWRSRSIINEQSAQILDYPALGAYAAANQNARADVVIFGDSIAQGLPALPNSLNRSLSGQYTAQLLLRFEQDVVDLHPQRVIIFAGINDVARQTDRGCAFDATTRNIRAMCELAKAHGIKVTLASLPPADDSASRPTDKIISLNKWIKEFAETQAIEFLDIYSLLSDNGKYKAGLSTDGLHPNEKGYALIRNSIQ